MYLASKGKKKLGTALKRNVTWLLTTVTFFFLPCDTGQLLNSSETVSTLYLKQQNITLEIQDENSPANFSWWQSSRKTSRLHHIPTIHEGVTRGFGWLVLIANKSSPISVSWYELHAVCVSLLLYVSEAMVERKNMLVFFFIIVVTRGQKLFKNGEWINV